jgi:hypothetical protein
VHVGNIRIVLSSNLTLAESTSQVSASVVLIDALRDRIDYSTAWGGSDRFGRVFRELHRMRLIRFRGRIPKADTMSTMAKSEAGGHAGSLMTTSKLQAARIVLDERQFVTAVARDLDLTRTVLHNWVERLVRPHPRAGRG